jgi:beta-lactamase superfamily II metal-dependent hydrolase
MVSIQIDMFEVQLGAALMLQFRLQNGDIVRVLADAGVNKSSRYKREHVYDKLFDDNGPKSVWTDFSSSKPPKLDLIVGTHYDEDHLNGLIPIIEKLDLEIEEIWLPPVQDDDAKVSIDSVSSGESNLVQRMIADDSGMALKRYVSRRLDLIEEVDKIYKTVSEQFDRNNDSHVEQLRKIQEWRQNWKKYSKDKLLEDSSSILDFFEDQLSYANKMLGQEGQDHALECQEDEDQAFFDVVEKLKYQFHDFPWTSTIGLGRFGIFKDTLNRQWQSDSIFRSDQIALETIRKSAAKEAINATHLNSVVNAIKYRRSKGRNTRIVSESISQGMPRYFRWNGIKFEEANRPCSSELGFHLMGPSHELISKLHDKLPIGSYLLAYRAANLKSGSVTPSNRLSYVIRFHLNDQAILITGDAGFSDFAPARSTNYYPDLLNLLKPLHVVQIAHHGGNNHHFYQALDAAGMPNQRDWSFLLLSHAFQDASRPRSEFSRFVAQFRNNGQEDVSVLFTSQPLKSKVATILDSIHPAVPASQRANKGDVRLTYPDVRDHCRGGTLWKVQKHCNVV